MGRIQKFLLITIQKPDDTFVKSDWPKEFTKEIGEQITKTGGGPWLKEEGRQWLKENQAGIQILDDDGHEAYSFQKPKEAKEAYKTPELLALSQAGKTEEGRITAFVESVCLEGKDYVYILYFPMNISKITMYLNGERFAGGKMALLPVLGVLLLAILFAGVIYGFYITRTMKRLAVSIGDISRRLYLPVAGRGAFQDLYQSLNMLNMEIKAGDRLRAETEQMRKEWIANITHDLKAPLSPVKGYAELMGERELGEAGQYKAYARAVSYIFRPPGKPYPMLLMRLS